MLAVFKFFNLLTIVLFAIANAEAEQPVDVNTSINTDAQSIYKDQLARYNSIVSQTNKAWSNYAAYSKQAYNNFNDPNTFTPAFNQAQSSLRRYADLWHNYYATTQTNINGLLSRYENYPSLVTWLNKWNAQEHAALNQIMDYVGTEARRMQAWSDASQQNSRQRNQQVLIRPSPTGQNNGNNKKKRPGVIGNTPKDCSDITILGEDHDCITTYGNPP